MLCLTGTGGSVTWAGQHHYLDDATHAATSLTS